MSQGYRNARKGFFTDLLVDTTPIGAIVPNLKTGQNSFDNTYVRAGASDYPALSELQGDAYLNGDDPAYSHDGYLYCDGSVHNISDYPALFEVIGNDYGGRSSSGIDVVNGGGGYTSPPIVDIDPPGAGGQTYNLNGTDYPIMGSLYVPPDLTTVDVVVVFHGTLGSTGTIADAAEYQRNLWLNSIVIKDKIIFSVAYPQDHITNQRQYGLPNVGAETATFLMGDNLPYCQAAVEWAKSDLIPYLATRNITKTLGDVYLFGHSQGGKIVTQLNTVLSGIAGVIANAPGPIQFDQTCAPGSTNAGSLSCTKVANIHGASAGDGSQPYQSIGLESYTSGHSAPLLFLQALDDDAGDGNQYQWMLDYYNDLSAAGANCTLYQLAQGGHAAYETDPNAHVQIRNFVNSTTLPTGQPFFGSLAPSSGTGTGVQAQAVARIDIQTNEVIAVDVVVAGSGYDYLNPPNVTFSGGGGSNAQAVVRINKFDGSIEGINRFNVLENWGDPYLGTFAVPDTKARKIVGNSPVYGNNSPNIGNSTLGVGTTGGAWYFDKQQQDDYFSLGRITTTGYDQVVETTAVDIIGSQTVTITMRESKLPGAPQHTHTVFHSIPGTSEYISEASGDRYLQDYREGNGRLTRWYPTTGQVFTHKHGLLRQPNTDNTVATYDVLDYLGGAGGNGTIKNPGAAETDQFYLASGEQGAGTYEFQTYIPNPISLIFTGASVIGGRTINTGGTPIYDFSDEWTYTSPGGPYTINLGNLSGGAPDNLIIEAIGGGGSGAAGTAAGNDGTNTIVKVGDGSKIWLTAGGGKGGGATNGQNGGSGGDGGSVNNAGSESFSGTAGQQGFPGTPGVAYNGWPKIDYPNNPNGGGLGGGQTIYTPYGDATSGINVLVGGQSGTFTQTLSSDGSFNLNSVGNPISATFSLWGGKGGNARGGYTGALGGYVVLQVSSGQLNQVKSYSWSVELGPKASGRNGGNAPHAGDGGYGGEGYQDADGGGGGASSILKRGSLIVAGAGGGGGAGATGYDGGAGVNGSGPPVGLQATTSALGPGAGGTGGHYGCIGGGGGGGGAGVARNGLTFGGQGNGGASGGPGGAPGGDGGHQGGGAGLSGVSSYRSDIFSSGSLGTAPSKHPGATISIDYNDDYWTPGGGGGGTGGWYRNSKSWGVLDSPGAIQVWVGQGGAGASMGGSTSGSTSGGGNGYVRIGLGKIVGYEGGFTSTTTGDVIAEASVDANTWDLNIYGNGDGTGTAGNFKLPNNQTPQVYVVGDGTGASVTASLAGNRVSSLTLGSGGAGFTEVPYIYVMNGSGSVAVGAATLDPSTGEIATLQMIPGSSQVYTNYLKFGGTGNASNPTRFAITIPVDTENANYFSIKCCRGNGVNGGNVPEEVLRAYYRLEGTTTWVLLDTIVNPNAVRNDPIIGNVPPVNQTWDGSAGNTKWYTYSVALPQQAKSAATQFKIEQPRAVSSAANDNAEDTDHYGIAEFIIWNEKVTELVFVPSPGAISKPAIDSLSYTIQGETGPGITYSSGLAASDATLTLKSTTKIEPQGVIDPDFHIPMLHPYRLCKYLIKAF